MIGKEVLNYRIVSFIGKGGMGSVYLAEHKFISAQKVAIKVINSDMANDYTRARLKEEAEHLAELKHQNIVTFHDYHIDEDGNIYLIMEYADGKSLDEYIRTQSGLIVQERICPMFEPILDAVGYAHKHNILHRDIKPSNVVITTDGTPKILDFGIATLITQGAEAEKDNIIIGTPSYMSPEQVRGEALDERSDIYSLGVMLHQMLTGNPPYDLTTLSSMQINQKVVNEPLPRLRTFYKYISEKVQKVVDKATAKRPQDRYQTCAEFKRALHNAVYPPKVSKAVWIGVAAFVIALLGAGAYYYYYWDFNRTKVSYYKDYVEQYGVPVGIGPVGSDVMQNREFTYRFETSQNKVRRVSLVNAKGNLCNQTDLEFVDRPCDMQIFYSDNGKVDFIKVLDQSGKVIYRKDYNENLSQVTFQYDDQYNTEMTLGNMDPTRPNVMVTSDEKSKISRQLLSYDENGHVIKMEFAGMYNRKIGDKNGIYAHEYTLDDKGRIIEVQYLGANGEPKGISNVKNLCKRVYTYNENDDWTEIMYLTKDDLPAHNGQGVVMQQNSYDQYGNKIAEYYTDLDRNMVYRTDLYAAGLEYTFENGLRMDQTYIGTDGQPCSCKDGYTSILYTYDDNGYMSGYTFLDAEGNPYENMAGTASVTILNNPQGLELEKWDYDAQGELAANQEGIAGIKMEYDSLGNETQIMYFDQNRKAYMTNEGVSGYRYEYNDKNLLIQQMCIDENGNPINDEEGVGIYRVTRDPNGNETQVAYYDVTGKNLVESDANIAGYNYTYDEYGNLIRTSYFDRRGLPALFYERVASVEYRYNNQHQMTAKYYRGLNDELVLDQDGIAGYEWKKDENDNVVEETYIGLDGKPAKGYLISMSNYDGDNMIAIAYYNTSNKPATNSRGYHKKTCVYDPKGQLTEEHYFNEKLEPVIIDEKYSIVKYQYDEKGLTTQVTYYGTKGEACLCKDGYHMMQKEYDKFGRVIKEQYFTKDKKPTNPKVMVPVGLCDYDKFGNMIFLAAQDQDGHYIIHPALGYAISRAVYDKAGNILELTYFDQNDQPMNIPEGYHKVARQYNKMGKKTQEAYYDKNLKPVLVNGAHMWKYTYDERGNTLTEAQYGKNEKPLNNASGYYKCVYTYTSDGEYKTGKLYAANGTLKASYKYSPTKGWEEVGQSQPQKNPTQKQETTYTWKEMIEEMSAELPYDLGEKAYNISITACKVTGEKQCLFKYRAPLEKKDIDDSMMEGMKDIINQMTRTLCKEVLEESGLRVDAELYSADGKLIYTVAYRN